MYTRFFFFIFVIITYSNTAHDWIHRTMYLHSDRRAHATSYIILYSNIYIYGIHVGTTRVSIQFRNNKNLIRCSLCRSVISVNVRLRFLYIINSYIKKNLETFNVNYVSFMCGRLSLCYSNVFHEAVIWILACLAVYIVCYFIALFEAIPPNEYG